MRHCYKLLCRLFHTITIPIYVMAQNNMPLKKISIESKHATVDSISTNNLKIQLPQTCQLPDNCVFFIFICDVCDVCIPHT